MTNIPKELQDQIEEVLALSRRRTQGRWEADWCRGINCWGGTAHESGRLITTNSYETKEKDLKLMASAPQMASIISKLYRAVKVYDEGYSGLIRKIDGHCHVDSRHGDDNDKAYAMGHNNAIHELRKSLLKDFEAQQKVKDILGGEG